MFVVPPPILPTQNFLSTQSITQVSVCVAIYNVAPYLRECLESLHRQTLTESEFLLVDDGSTDECSDICNEFASIDSRFKIIRNKSNRGLLIARKIAISQLKGLYTLFLDGDDLLSSDTALATAVHLMKENDVDILRYTSRAFSAVPERESSMEELLNKGVKNTIYSSDEYLHLVFSVHEHNWAIWNRIYRSDVLKAALPYIPDEYFVAAENVFLLFLFSVHARRIVSKDTEQLYAYRLGAGISTNTISLEKYVKHYSREIRCTRWMERVARDLNRTDDLATIVADTRMALMKTNCCRLKALALEDQAQGFDALAHEGFTSELITAMAEIYTTPDAMAKLAKALVSAQILKLPKQTVKTIGFLYHRYFEGGVERVMSLQMQIFLKLGYRVVLMTDIVDPEKEFILPLGVEREKLPSNYKERRAFALREMIFKHGIDLVMVHKASSLDVFWDLLLIRLCGVHSVVTLHEGIMHNLLVKADVSIFDFDIARPLFYRFASRLCVLNQAVAAYFSVFGVNSQFLPNPVTFLPEEIGDVPEACEREGVCWIARLDKESKNYLSMLQIFKKLVDRNNTSQCFIAGPEYSPGSGAEVQRFILENHLENNVYWLGGIKDVKDLLKKAKVLCMTSRFESFSMTLLEAKACGTPVVMFDLPYLELVKSRKGIRVVPQNAIDMAVSTIFEILDDNDLCNKLIKEQVDDLKDFYQKYNVPSLWKDLLKDPGAPSTQCALSCVAEELTAQVEIIKQNVVFKQQTLRCMKRIYHLKAFKYFICGKLWPSHARRRYYRDKLWNYLFNE